MEECVCRVLRESPTLIAHDSRSSMTTPLAEDGSPDWDGQDYWVGPGLSPLPKSSIPIDRESLQEWAIARAEAHFDRCWESAINDWESSPNRVGLAEDLDKEEGWQLSLIHI